MEAIETTETIETDAGTARVTWHRAEKPRLVLAVSHGAGGGIEARDLQALASVLPGHGVSVALVEQPWRVAGKKVAPAPKTLDVGWRGLWPAVAKPGLPVVAGGRSAGARVACRTATELGATAVLALSFPLHPPGKPEKSRADELLGAGVPTLVVQGGNDPFGKPEEFPKGSYELIEVPYGDHGFAVPMGVPPRERSRAWGRASIDQDAALEIVTDGVVGWIASLG
ncbi:hydrolase [Streptomyces sp. NBC_01340]|uniref:alpha/beta hydrolase family protein n=1 Tax=unclassified Streptomyces TaxID=2593676 RepID=UPI00224F9392|nr:MULTISPECIES: alpha/beta family hydrolase [unclassified Streptomyces]MCX4456690.1 hydrolase [Streptomyces sp. NBC_01719]MCX4496048.1 hydrolase [Streptomyces sp. NBC_01728]MCX4589362.1 hydrolase [Streptomyces sp. NBC_01549]WSI40983.1 hydrolase [Streptomyces sp. NBC_01340]